MKHLNLKKILLTLTFIFFIQNNSILLPDLPESTYSNEELISPQSDLPTYSTHVT